MYPSWIRPLFIIAGLYDSILALVFLFFAGSVFQALGVTPPNHPGYVQFPALLLLILGAMFFRIARDPVGNRDLIWYGIALKVAYSGTVFFHQLASGVPSMWIPWAWADLVFLVLFVLAWRSIAGRGAPRPA